MSGKHHRLTKYLRRKRRALRLGHPRFEHLMALYWRYHHQVYGPPAPLWGKPVPAAKGQPKRPPTAQTTPAYQLVSRGDCL